MTSSTQVELLKLELERARNDLARSRDALPVLLALRKREAAAAVGISERTMHRLIERGEIRAKRTDGAVLVPVAELERWLNDCGSAVARMTQDGPEAAGSAAAGEAVPSG